MSNWYKQSSMVELMPYLDIIKKMTDWQFNPKIEDFAAMNITPEQVNELCDFVVGRINSLEPESIRYLKALTEFVFNLGHGERWKDYKSPSIRCNRIVSHKIKKIIKENLSGTTREERCMEYVQKVDELAPLMGSFVVNILKNFDFDAVPDGEYLSYQQCKRDLESQQQGQESQNELV